MKPRSENRWYIGFCMHDQHGVLFVERIIQCVGGIFRGKQSSFFQSDHAEYLVGKDLQPAFHWRPWRYDRDSKALDSPCDQHSHVHTTNYSQHLHSMETPLARRELATRSQTPSAVP